MVAVCGSCKTLSARTDRDPELIGIAADLVDLNSPISLQATGVHAGRDFTIAGRVQMRHPLGGVWNEWYLAFEDGRWGWLAEAVGKFYLTFQHDLANHAPPFEALHAGAVVNLGDQGQWVVAEASEAAFHGAEGELPWRPELGGTYRFGDLSGAHGAFATLDYGDAAPVFYLGRELALDELRLRNVREASPRLKVLSLNCPNCSAPLPLRAPDATLRVVCTSCGGMLDAEGGKLRYLKSLKQPPVKFHIDLGAEGVLRTVPLICIGRMQRSCKVEGVTYPWREYLLMDRKGGFKWLVESDGHWNLAESVAAGDVDAGGINPTALKMIERSAGPEAAARMREAMASGGAHSPFVKFKGASYRRFQDVEARVDAVYGEFTWKVQQGEKAQVTEFVQPPLSLARETQAHAGGGEEVNWTLSTYLEPAEILAGFNLKEALPAPTGICPNMPNPHKRALAQMGIWMVLALGALLAVVMVLSITHREKLVFSRTYNLATELAALRVQRGASAQAQNPASPGTAAPPESEPVFFAGPIEVKERGKNLAVTLASTVDNGWIGLEGALVSEQTGAVEQFEIQSSYYHGVDDGESWSEGSRRDTVYLSSLPPGAYMLRLSPAWEGPVPPVREFTLELRSGVMRWLYIWIAFFAIVIGPLLKLFQSMGFEGRRWAESMYSGQGGSSDSDSDSGGDD
ncbi:MAG: DUF4178 domain-containing protein [Holophagaceae bacterium]|nr:DUF4178 domain-containing protein [Holophagaceae bacterium]